MACIGFGLIGISVLGENPGYGVLSLFLIYCMTLSHVMFFIRVAVMLVLVGCHVAAIMVFNQARVCGADDSPACNLLVRVYRVLSTRAHILRGRGNVNDAGSFGRASAPAMSHGVTLVETSSTCSSFSLAW